MAKKKKKEDLRPVLKDAHAHFYLLKDDETIRLRLWEITEDSLVIDRPEGMPMKRTALGYIPTLDGNAIFQMEGKIETTPLPDQLENTIRIVVDPSKVRRVDRRLYPRVSFTPPLAVSVSPEGGGKEIRGSIINLSASGLRLETSEGLLPSEVYTFKFEVDLDDEIHAYSPVGMVVYDLPSDAGHAYGIRFGRPKDREMRGGEVPIGPLDTTINLMELVNRLLLSETK
jgi:hypothetical protein